MPNLMKGAQANPYQRQVTETYKPDNSRQVNIKGPDGNTLQLNQGADGNLAVTKTETVDFSKVLPFTSLQPAAAAMDQIFGGQMARAMPSQKDLISQYRQLQGKEADPMADLKRRLMEAQIGAMGRKKEMSEVDKANIELKRAQTDKAKSEAALREKQVTSEVEIPGYSHDKKIGVRPGDAAKLRNATAGVDELKQTIKDYREMIKQQGTVPDDFESLTRMRRLYTRMQMALKNEEALGALTGPDEKILEREVGAPPGTPGSIFTTNAAALSGLDTLEQEIENRLDKKMTQFGYAKTGSSAPKGMDGLTPEEEAELAELEAMEAAQAGR